MARRVRMFAPEPPVFRFRVRLGFGYSSPDEDEHPVVREIELAANHTLAALGDAIPRAFGFDNDHLWRLFFSCKPWDLNSAYGIDDVLEGHYADELLRLRR